MPSQQPRPCRHANSQSLVGVVVSILPALSVSVCISVPVPVSFFFSISGHCLCLAVFCRIDILVLARRLRQVAFPPPITARPRLQWRAAAQ